MTQPPGLPYQIRTVTQGDVLVSARSDVVLRAVLGSCIAVCLYDPVRKVGGMNHFLLPDCDAPQASAAERYGSFAIENLINKLLSGGSLRASLKARVFGGGDTLGHTHTRYGDQNAAFALSYLATEGIAVAGQDIGGAVARRVDFLPVEGLSRCRQMPISAVRPAPRPPQHALPPMGEVELF